MLAAASAILTLFGHYQGKRQWVYLFKPLTTALILVVSLTAGGWRFAPYTLWIAFGLIFSIAGDVLLMLPGNRFIPGLASFLCAHILYTVAFLTRKPDSLFYWPLLPMALYGFLIFRMLSRFLGHYRKPVMVYIIVIVAMSWQAWETVFRLSARPALLAGTGAVLFMLSDSILAWNRFRRPFQSAEAIKLGLYYTAQWMIALSTSP